MGVDSPIVERHTSNTPGALWTIGLVFPTESTSPWTFPRRKQREAKRSHVAWFQGNMKATPDRAAIFHNSREGRRWWKESSRVSFLSGPWNFAPSSQALRVPFHSPRDDRYSRLFHGYFLKVVARVSAGKRPRNFLGCHDPNHGTVMTSRAVPFVLSFCFSSFSFRFISISF